jgi:hypothetical protein
VLKVLTPMEMPTPTLTHQVTVTMGITIMIMEKRRTMSQTPQGMETERALHLREM